MYTYVKLPISQGGSPSRISLLPCGKVKDSRPSARQSSLSATSCERSVSDWHAESKLAALTWQGDRGPPSPRLRRDSLRSPLPLRAKTGGKGIRTPDFQLAKLALYQLSYAPVSISGFGKRIAERCRETTLCRLFPVFLVS